ncbi:TPA: P-type conjugative transfer protein TrbL, partial [Pseudomonas aeruginosa]|nr:P-type conjugative transfer protein TrbL [Pseudomonas aeruginosa]HCF4021721.1 P-type conjugative transfer protein TrbL [Pseudomonas aeruginosa]
AKSAFQAGSAAAGGGAKGAAAGLGNVAKTGAQAAGRRAASGAASAGQKVADSFRAGWNGTDAGATGSSQAATGEGAGSAPKQEQPAWAKRMHRRQQITHAATTAAHTLRGGDGGGSGQGPSLRPDE